jgi:Tfp pilus assembly protein PilF/DNA-binding transcriptional MerR regulator
MTELYSVRDVAKIFAVQESRLRYWMQVGFVGPTVRKGGRFYYTFRDLVAVKSAKDLLAAGLPLQKVRKNLDSLREAMPGEPNPAAKLRICSDGETIVAIDDAVGFEPATRQVVMAFELPTLAGRVAEIMAEPGSRPAVADGPEVRTTGPAAALAAAAAAAVPTELVDDPTEANSGNTAYRCFLEACAAEDRGDPSTAEHLYRQAVDLEPSLAAALTNLGNLMYRQGDTVVARQMYERALELEPAQPEARYNLGNILEDLGETDLAIAELRRVCAAAPEFADAHYNLGLMLARVGGATQARHHLERYLELDPDSPWADRARGFLGQL